MQRFLALYKDDKRGTTDAEEADFYKRLGFILLRQINFPVQGWADLLKKRGPLSVTIKPNPQHGTLHGIVVTGMRGDGTALGTRIFLVDPADGQEHWESLKDFVKRYEGASGYALQIAHLVQR